MCIESIKSKKYWYLLLLAGIVSLAFGVIGITRNPELTGSGAMLIGMFTGMGAAIAGVSVVRLLYLKFAPAKKLKAEEIQLKDERNIQVIRAAYAVSNTAATILFAVMAFVFVWLNYIPASYIAVGAMWLQIIVFLISYRILCKKM